MRQSIKKITVILFFSCFQMFAQGPDPCPCDPTEGEVAYELCLAAHPECDEDIPIDKGISILVALGAGYAIYNVIRKRKNGFIS